MLVMRRVLVTLLIAIFGFVPSGFALFASDSDSNLPLCCRGHGKHHCAMMANRSASSSDAALRADRCPLFPRASALVAHRTTGVPRASQAYFSEFVSRPAANPQRKTLYRISYNRADQKRGPPSSRS